MLNNMVFDERAQKNQQIDTREDIQFVEHIAYRLGYKSVDLTSLALSEADLHRVDRDPYNEPGAELYYSATRDDGHPVKAVIRIRKLTGTYAVMTVFSPAFQEGVFVHHHYTGTDLERALTTALTGPVYAKPKF